MPAAQVVKALPAFCDLRLKGMYPFVEIAVRRVRLLEFRPDALDRRVVVRHIVAQDGDLRPALRRELLDLPDAPAPRVDLDRERLHLREERVDLPLDAVELRLDAVVLVAAEQDLVLLLPQHRPGFVERQHPEGDFQRLLLPRVFEELRRLFRLRPQRFHTAFELVEDVPQAKEVFLRGLQAALGLELAVAVLGDPRRLLKDFAALGALGADDLGDLALPDDRVAVPPEPRVHEELVDVLEAHRRAVQPIFALPRAVELATDRDHVAVAGERAVGVVDREQHLRVALRFARLRAAENDVLHLAAAQRLRRLLPQHPAHRVRDVALARAVRPDDGRDAVVEAELCAVGEGFEPLYLQAAKTQCHTSFISIARPESLPSGSIFT